MKAKVLVLDMQPIDPPVGGGRLRLLGLYHGLGQGLPTTYVGSYDWPGPSFREQHLTATLREVLVPLSDKQFQLAKTWATFAERPTVIDVTFPILGRASEDFLERCLVELLDAEIVVFSHPWLFPLLRESLEFARQLIVYDSQNFEGLLRTELLGENPFGTEISKHVITSEFELAHSCDLILACSREDVQLFSSIYGVPEGRLVEIPNGVFTERITPPTPEQRRTAREHFCLNKKTVLFFGSAYQPNIEAAEFIINRLAGQLPQVDFLIGGGVSETSAVSRGHDVPNVHLTGFLSEEQKLSAFWGADLAINPMFSGSGTNIKMFDFMAAGLPIVATQVGARGITAGVSPVLITSDISGFGSAVSDLLEAPERCRYLSIQAREFVVAKHSWEQLSPNLGTILSSHLEQKKSVLGCESAHPSNVGRLRQFLVDDCSGQTPKLGVLSTWGTRCGIAEYCRSLLEALSSKGVRCRVLANRDSRSEQGRLIPVSRTWDYGKVSAEAVKRLCLQEEIQHLNIQYHTGFFSTQDLAEIINSCKAEGLAVSVTLHDARLIGTDFFESIADQEVTLMVHSADEQRMLAQMGIENVARVPLGVLEIEDEPPLAARQRIKLDGNPVIGTFGFLRAHKGLPQLIKAMAILREIFVDIQLLALTAHYPSPDSEQCLAECRKTLSDNNLEKSVRMVTNFSPIESVIADLHACDLIVLPYQNSLEGASAAAGTAVAAKRPTITTRAPIFAQMQHVVYSVESGDPQTLAVAVANLISSPLLLETLQKRSRQYVEQNSWDVVAGIFLKNIAATPLQGESCYARF